MLIVLSDIYLAIYQITIEWLSIFETTKNIDIIMYGATQNWNLGVGHMSRASPANRADLSHENLYFSTTYRFI